MYSDIFVYLSVFLISVSGKSVGSNCSDDIEKSINNDTENLCDDLIDVKENIDIEINMPAKKYEIEDLRQILRNLTKLIEDKLDKNQYVLKHVSKKTKIFVTSFDLNVDLENGKANFDIDFTENTKVTTTIKETTDSPTEFKTLTDEIEEVTTEMSTASEDSNSFTTIYETINESNATNDQDLDHKINLHGGVQTNEIHSVLDFDTSYYDQNEDNSTDYPIIDYVEMYKDTTNEEYLYIPTELDGEVTTEANEGTESVEIIQKEYSDSLCNSNHECQDFMKTVFPWMATIFIKNDTENSQFNYYCDGVLLSKTVVITDARCVYAANQTVDQDNIVVFLGKGNLQAFGGNEKIHRVESVLLHPNFTQAGDNVTNDLALLVLEEPVTLTDSIQIACVHDEKAISEDVEEAATTSWGVDGDLTPIFFNKVPDELCFNKSEDVFCATYGNEVPLCPSYGSLYATKRTNRWCLQAIRYGDPAERGICFTKNVYYTSLTKYMQWINSYLV